MNKLSPTETRKPSTVQMAAFRFRKCDTFILLARYCL